MFIVSLTYKVPLEKVDEELSNHVRYLEEQYALGHFQLSGRKVPRSGGIIVSRLKDRKQLEEIVEQDPFFKGNLADYEIVEFLPTKASDELKSLLE